MKFTRFFIEEDLPARDQNYLEFGNVFEQQFLSQGQTESRTIVETLDLGWKVLSLLPQDELTRFSAAEIEQYYPEQDAGEQDG